MNYPCPRCAFGYLRAARSTYVRRWGPYLITQPNFPLWRCDACGYTRYDARALARLEFLLGREGEIWEEAGSRASRRAEGPADQGPRRWSP